MDRMLYLDPWSGASGDMIMASLLDAAGPDLDAELVVHRLVAGLGIPGVEVSVEQTVEAGFACRRVSVSAPGAQPARRLSDLIGLLDAADITDHVRGRAARALRRLASVEARLHGVDIEEVHLHELGAVDTLVDVAGCFALLDALGVTAAFHGPVPLGGGWIDSDHGPLRVPAPATLALLEGCEVRGGPVEAELTTPTGALLLTEAALPVSVMPVMRVERVGYGCGHRTLSGHPNLLRAMLGEAVPPQTRTGSAVGPSATDPAADVVVLQVVIDDATPELTAHTCGLLMTAGALDVWFAPVTMKKGRPGVEVTALAPPGLETHLVEVLFRETSSFGVRRSLVARHVLERSLEPVTVAGQTLPVKIGRWGGRVVTVSPEYESAVVAAAQSGRPLKEVMVEAAAAGLRIYGSEYPSPQAVRNDS